MRYGALLKVLPYVVLLLISTHLWCAEYKDGKLYLEIMLCSGKEISLSGIIGVQPEFTIGEQGSPITLKATGDILIQLTNEDSSWGADKKYQPHKTYSWTNNTLSINEALNTEDEPSILDDYEYFIEQLYRQQHPSSFSWQESNPILRLTLSTGNVYFLQPPLFIESNQTVLVSGINLPFRGSFVLKEVNNILILNHKVPLETYIAGVVPNEIGSNAPMDALKAQAVAARTHALKMLLYNRHAQEGYDLCNTTHCQVYRGEYQQNANVLEAVAATSDEVLIWESELAETTYHSSSGGKTDSSSAIWKGKELPYSQGVVCFDQCAGWDLSKESIARRWIETPLNLRDASSWETATLNWSKSISKRQLAENLGMLYILAIRIHKRGFSGRITDMSFSGSNTIRLSSEYKIRNAFGSLMSSLFYIDGAFSQEADGTIVMYPEDVINIKGRGSGHGVGMSQVDALSMARQGKKYSAILSKFFPGTEIFKEWKYNDSK